MARQDVEAVFRKLEKVSTGDLSELDGPRAQSYLAAYPVFLRFFQSRPMIDSDTVILGASLVYSWMPTALKLKPQQLEDTARILEAIRNNTKPTAGDLTKVASTVNNSMVGASKLLHFIKPDRFPIYDRRVAHFLMWPTHDSAMQRVDRYQEYRELCGGLVKEPGFEKLTARLSSRVGKVGRLRAVELLMFLGGAK